MTNEQKLREALQCLYDETADYIRINHLGDVHQNRSMRMARDALSPQPTSDEGTPKTTRDVLVDDLIATKTPKHSETPLTEAARNIRAMDRGAGEVAFDMLAEELEHTLHAKERELAAPIDMLLFCPQCDYQHVDEPQPHKNWTNPPHRSHQCQKCGHIWRPCDRATNGVAKIETKGQHDLSADPATLPSVSAAPQELCTRCRLPLGKALNAFPHVPTEDGHRHEVCPQEGKADIPSEYIQVPRDIVTEILGMSASLRDEMSLGCYCHDNGDIPVTCVWCKLKHLADAPPPATPRGDGGEAIGAGEAEFHQRMKATPPAATVPDGTETIIQPEGTQERLWKRLEDLREQRDDLRDALNAKLPAAPQSGKKEDGWISVSSELPPGGIEVLAACDKGVFIVRGLRIHALVREAKLLGGSPYYTHWQRLPPAPSPPASKAEGESNG